MASSNGNFVWYDLMSTDAKAAEAFYRGVVGWRMQDAGLPDRSYTILSAGETAVGGLMPLPPEACGAGAKPVWSGYVAVDDVDAFAARVKQAGGAIHHPPDDIPGVGRLAFVADPQGATFVLFKGMSDAQPQPPAPGTPGHTGWRELHAADWESAFAFYSSLFGWTKADAVDMGAMGIYQLFAIDGVPKGGMMTKTKDVPAPLWVYYFNVDDIEAAAARVKNGGGQILTTPTRFQAGAGLSIAAIHRARRSLCSDHIADRPGAARSLDPPSRNRGTAGRSAVALAVVFADAKVAHSNFRAPRPGASVQANRRINGEGKSDGR